MIRIYEKETRGDSCSVLRVAAGTTGKKGGNHSHGCLTVIEIEDSNTMTDLGVEKIGEGGRGVRLVLGGDCELDSIIEAFEFILRKLKYGQSQK